MFLITEKLQFLTKGRIYRICKTIFQTKIFCDFPKCDEINTNLSLKSVELNMIFIKFPSLKSRFSKLVKTSLAST